MKTYLNTLKHISFYKMNRITSPVYCTFHVTWRCNLNCTMCNQKETRDIYIKEEMNLGQIEKAFSEMGQLDVIKLTGGEPFLRNDLKDMVKFFKKVNKPHVIYITTNGMFTDKIINFIEEVGTKSLLIAISIDGTSEVHDKIRRQKGSYNKVMETLKSLKKLNNGSLNIQINQTILGDNVNEIGKLEKTVQETNGYPVHYMIAEANFVIKGEGIETPIDQEDYYFQIPKENLEEVISKISQSKQKGLLQKTLDSYYYKGVRNRLLHDNETPRIKCTAMYSHFRIFPNGDIVACGRDNSPVGNLKLESFKEIWTSKKAAEKRDFVNNCKGCWSRCEVIPSAIYSGDFWKGIL